MRGGMWALALAAALLLVIPADAQNPPARKGLPKSPPRTKEFQQRVNGAVDRGIAWLRKRQKADGSFFTKWGEGETALAVLAMRAGGVPGEDPQVLRGLDSLRRAYPAGKKFEGGNTTYGVSLTLLALEAHFDAGPIPEGDRAWIASLADYLSKSRKPTGGFGYGLENEDIASMVNIDQPDYTDNSNSQFAVLGLGAARVLGCDVSPETWRMALRYWIRGQSRKGPPVPWYEPSGKDEVLYALGTARARGWAYNLIPIIEFGSMTAGGVSSVALCRDALQRELKADPPLDATSASSLKDGLAWLGRNFNPAGNPTSGESLMPPDLPPPPPGPPGRGPSPPPPKKPPKGKPTTPLPGDPPLPAPIPVYSEFQYYYLYGLERAGVLSDTAWMGTHDWYLEGAEYLLKEQQPDGAWEQSKSNAGMPGFASLEMGSQIDTCFALLFLKRATMRLKTPTVDRSGTSTTRAEASADPKVGPTLGDSAFSDLFAAVFRRFLAGTPERRAILAADFVQMGTRSIPLLIMRLESADPMERAAALEALRRTTGETRGFDPAAEDEARAKAVEAWERWWAARGKGLVADTDAGRFREGP